MTLTRAGFGPAQRGHICSSALRFNHSATGQGLHKVIYAISNIYMARKMT